MLDKAEHIDMSENIRSPGERCPEVVSFDQRSHAERA
jgi:hypothetical protein